MKSRQVNKKMLLVAHVSACLLGLSTVCFPEQSVVGAQEANRPKPYPPMGKLVDIGGWRLHLNCTGKSSGKMPTIVLESGAGDFSVDWGLVQPGVARFARVCSYDRAGAGWSDLGPRPRTMRQITYELHTVLKKAGEKGPFVMVGQSVGGLLVRVYASQYPKEVVGMVLVDSTHEDTVLMISGKLKRMRELSQGRTVPPVRDSMTAAEKELSTEEKEQTDNHLKQIGTPKIGAPYNRLPKELQDARLWVLAQPRHYTADSDPYWGEEFSEIYTARQKQGIPLGDAPLAVLLTKPDSGNPPPGISGDAVAEWKRVNEEKRQQKVELTRLSRNSKLIVAENSGHHIQLDEPQVVINAIQQVAEAARKGSQLVP